MKELFIRYALNARDYSSPNNRDGSIDYHGEMLVEKYGKLRRNEDGIEIIQAGRDIRYYNGGGLGELDGAWELLFSIEDEREPSKAELHKRFQRYKHSPRYKGGMPEVSPVPTLLWQGPLLPEKEPYVGSYDGVHNERVTTAHEDYKKEEGISRVYPLLYTTAWALQRYGAVCDPNATQLDADVCELPTLLDGGEARTSIKLNGRDKVEDSHAENFAVQVVPGYLPYEMEDGDALRRAWNIDKRLTDREGNPTVSFVSHQAAKEYARRSYTLDVSENLEETPGRTPGREYNPEWLESHLLGILNAKDLERFEAYRARFYAGLPVSDADRQWFAELENKALDLWIEAHDPATSAPVDWDLATNNERKKQNAKLKKAGLPDLAPKTEDKRTKDKPLPVIRRNSLSNHSAITSG
jgi:hypothetical protein